MLKESPSRAIPARSVRAYLRDFPGVIASTGDYTTTHTGNSHDCSDFDSLLAAPNDRIHGIMSLGVPPPSADLRDDNLRASLRRLRCDSREICWSVSVRTVGSTSVELPAPPKFTG